jgi:hypothetical protein
MSVIAYAALTYESWQVARCISGVCTPRVSDTLFVRNPGVCFGSVLHTCNPHKTLTGRPMLQHHSAARRQGARWGCVPHRRARADA